MKYHGSMNWQKLLTEMSEYMTLRQIAEACGFASAGHVHDVRSGKHLSVAFPLGTRIIAEHARVMRKAKRKEKAAQ
jgi:hypothetical protein